MMAVTGMLMGFMRGDTCCYQRVLSCLDAVIVVRMSLVHKRSKLYINNSPAPRANRKHNSLQLVEAVYLPRNCKEVSARKGDREQASEVMQQCFFVLLLHSFNTHLVLNLDVGREAQQGMRQRRPTINRGSTR
jgi:hypothetical protein